MNHRTKISRLEPFLTPCLVVLLGAVSLNCDKEPAQPDQAPVAKDTDKAAEPAPAPEPAEAAAPAPEPAPEPEPEPAPANTGLRDGTFDCSFADSSGSYNRRCTVKQDGSAFVIRAPGTKLNPGNGFDGSLAGGPDSYIFSGDIAGFDDCVGEFETKLERDGDAFVAKAKLDSGCPITIRMKVPVEAAAEPAAEPAAAGDGGGLAVGKHSCSFADSTGSYNRVCTVSGAAGSPLTVKAPGTKLNPDNGFSGQLTGGPEGYQFSGEVAGFDNCVGSFEATVETKGDAYVARAKLDSGCQVSFRINTKLK